MIDLKGKAALVTGGSRGIGRATCRLLAQAGADVAFSYHTNQRAAKITESEIVGAHRRCLALPADLSRRADADRLIRETVKSLGRLDILVNNHGIWKDGPIESMSEEDWDETLDINLKGVYLCTRAAVSLMKRQGGGRIINIASTAGQRGEAGHSHYAASKEITLDHKFGGDVFGWSAMTEPYIYTLSALSVQDSELLQFKADDLKTLCKRNSHLGYILMNNISEIISERFSAQQRILIELVRQRIKEKEI